MAICLSNALISMHNNDSNATELLSEKTDHGLMRFGHIHDNIQALRQTGTLNFNLLATILNSVDTKASFQMLLQLIY